MSLILSVLIQNATLNNPTNDFLYLIHVQINILIIDVIIPHFSAIVPSGFLQVSVKLDKPQWILNWTFYLIYSSCPTIHVFRYSGQMTMDDNNNKDEAISLNVSNKNNDNSSSYKSRQKSLTFHKFNQATFTFLLFTDKVMVFFIFLLSLNSRLSTTFKIWQFHFKNFFL